MRIPLSWLGEWVDLPEDVSLESVHESLVKVGFEEEDVHTFDVTGPVVVGQVISAVPEEQTNGKTINWCQVDVGEAEPRGIVCGAHNFAAGDKVVVTLPGAVLPGPFPIAARKTYGHTSDGMIASARELGLGDEHDGILRLADLGLDDAPVGADAIHLLGLDDAAIEINVTPDRGYAFSIRGVAREYSHSTGAAFRDPALAVTVTPGTGFDVTIDDQAPIRGTAGSRAFATRVVRGVDVTRPTPPWMVARLSLAGMRSISLPVDITNYVMLELGQPIHGYDLATLTGGFVVRRATAKEKLTTLDGVVRTLSTEDLLITDGSGPIGLAGVMGGGTTEISDATTDILIEAANFDPITVARTARRHKLPSEASRRFERGVDPTLGPVAAQRVVDLLVSLAGGTADSLGSVYDSYPAPTAIEFDPAKPAAVIGVEYTETEVHDALVMIGASVDSAGNDRWTVTPPSWRPDLTDQLTLVEEVARIVGYDRIPSVLPIAPPGRGLTRAQLARRRAAATLAAAGATEVLAYPFSSAAMVALFDPDAPAMKLANPLDPQNGLLRRSVLPGLVEIARRNLSRGLTDLALFEIGTVFLPETGVVYGTDFIPVGDARPDAATLEKLNASIPPQHWHVGALFLGDALAKQPGAAAVPTSLTDALDVVRQLSVALAVDITIATGAHPALHPGRTAELRVATPDGPRVVGVAGELLPSRAHQLDLPRVVALVELDLDALIELGALQSTPTQLGTLPAATQDLSLVVPVDAPARDVLAAVVAGAGALLEDARLVDDYRGSGLPDGRKSLTFALRFRAPDRTLTAAEASEAKLAGARRAGELFGATVRE
jgi:phenylalanyl-tRNA synthetase beta chain